MQPGAVGHLDDAQAQGTWTEGSDHQVQEHSEQHISSNAAAAGSLRALANEFGQAANSLSEVLV